MTAVSTHVYTPGDLVRARGREWVVLPSSEPELLRLRPLSGGESSVQVLHPGLERRPVEPATFGLPTVDPVATQDAARLLSDAVRLSLRRGAGPFRSAARVGFEPRAYQLVPLLMALRLPIARLLIADDVGVGKTIEAGLIARELHDRGELDRFAVLCPPHLVEQWTAELRSNFDFDPVAVTAASAPRLERGLPPGQSLFDAYPCTVVSLDYIKADKRREGFAAACPSLVIVDEAHACVGGEHGRHQRFELLQRLASDASRHLLLLTATPHSGDEAAFDRLLGLLDPALTGGAGFATEAGRIRLARHFVQRRRIDITGKEWGEDRVFPHHQTKDEAYSFDAPTQAFHDAVLDWCLGVVERAGGRARLAFWGVLALMRCVGSSPAAAAAALRNRMASDQERLAGQVLDEDDDTDAVDIAPSVTVGGTPDSALTALAAQAERLAGGPDPKLKALVALLRPVLAAGANPVVFCRYLATADYVRVGLQAAFRAEFPGLRIEAVTGELPPDDRRARVDAMGEPDDDGAIPQRLLVATDCLSEGINLQTLFDAVVHYDLSWNPTRHQQREGRVNRFGQKAREVRSVLMFSEDSAIDGAVLQVILRKADAIRERTGVSVPLPEDRAAVSGALMNAVLLRRGSRRQLDLFDGQNDTATMEARWRDAEEGEKRSRARFAQNAMHPDEVAPEWRRWRDVLGAPSEVQRFVERALRRLQAPLEPAPRKGAPLRVNIPALPTALRERMAARALHGIVPLGFEAEVPGQHVTRSHPLTAILAEALLEGALDPGSPVIPPVGRAGAWTTAAVSSVTTVLLLRLRFKLTPPGRRGGLLLAEEAGAVAILQDGTVLTTGDAARALLEVQAAGDLAEGARTRMVAAGLIRASDALSGAVAEHARARAAVLASDHERVRAADGRRGMGPGVLVEAVLPPDVIGLFVLVPAL